MKSYTETYNVPGLAVLVQIQYQFRDII